MSGSVEAPWSRLRGASTLPMEPVIRFCPSALIAMPCRSSCVHLASKRRYCWTLKDRSYASFTYPRFHPCITVVGFYRLGSPDGRQFHHRVQLVERGGAGQYVGQHAVVQHCPRGGGYPGGLHRTLRSPCARTALRRHQATRLPPILPPDSDRPGPDCDVVRVLLD